MRIVIRNLLAVVAGVGLIFGLAAIVLLICGLRPYILSSGSMAPTMPKGSLVLINTRVKPEDLVVGDVVAYRSGDTLVLHRLVGDNLLQGDANPTAQKVLIDNGNLIGIEKYCIPRVGKVFSYLHDHSVPILIIAGVLIVIACLPYRHMSKEGSK